MKKILLFNGQSAIVDDADFERLSQFRWHLSGGGYPTRSKREGKITKHIRMHADILGLPPDGFVTDHKNRDRLDNSRGNLRFINKSSNARNSNRKAKGVYYHKRAKKWAINLSVGDKTLYFGLFETEEEAIPIAQLLRGALIYHELTKGTGN